MIKLYEVKVPLDGYTMSVLMASPDAETAKSEVAKQLRASAEPRSAGDVLQYNWRRADMIAAEVAIQSSPSLHDQAQAMLDATLQAQVALGIGTSKMLGFDD